MSIIVPRDSTSIVQAIGGLGPKGLRQVYETARYLYSALPDTRKEASQARSTFERKVNMPSKSNNTGVVGGGKPGKFAGVLDKSNVSSGGGMNQRSMTSSRQLSRGNGGGGGKMPKERIPKSPYMDKIQVCYRANTQLTNTALNAWGQGVAIAVASAATDLSVYMTQLTALAGLYREFRCMKLDVDFIPRVGSTAAGVIAVAVDRDPRTGTPSGTSEVIRRDPFFEVDIKQPGNFTWKPITDDDRRWRYTIDATRPIEFLSHGTIIGWSNNDQPLAGIIGELFYNGWFEFAIPL